MEINNAFPSRYLRVTDLAGENVKAIVDHVEQEKIGNDNKLVVHFRGGMLKPLALNKTNARRIAELARSTDTDDWEGTTITMYETDVEFQGETVPAIRIMKPAKVKPQPKPKLVPTEPMNVEGADDYDPQARFVKSLGEPEPDLEGDELPTDGPDAN